jgi:L-xylulokinase
MTLLLGIDAGLTTTTAALYTPDGAPVASASRETPAERPRTGWREVSLEDLWTVVAGTVADAVADAPGSPADIAAVGVAGHGHGLYLLDADGQQVRPAVKSTDSRATDLVEEWEADGTAGRMRERLGYGPFGVDPLSLLGWLDRHEPDALERAETLLFCKDYLKYRLTGRVCTDEMEASVFYGAGNGYDRGIFDALGVDVTPDILPAVVPSGEAFGHVTGTAAAETGLAAETPVASGLHDVGATALGSGAYRAGQAVLVVGTWGQSIVVLDDPPAGVDGGTAPGLTRRYLDGHLRYKGLRSAAVCLDWFTGEVGDEWRRRADREGVDEYEVYDRVAADVPAGARGLLFHPYLTGSTDNPTDRGGFYGLTTDHTKAHMLRAVYEGVAISQAARLDELAPPETTEIRLGGGGARSEVWSDIFAAAVDHPLAVPAGEEAGARGAAICGALAGGVHPDYATAVDEMVAVTRRHDPDPAAAAVYDERHETFESTLEAVRPMWERLTNEAENRATDD